MKQRPFKQGRPLVLDRTVDLGPLAELMTVRLRRVDVLLSRSFAAAHDRSDMRAGMTSTLALIVANGGISQNAIAQQTGIDKSAIAGIVDRLEELGWAVRRRSATDRRRHELHATDTGREELNQIAKGIRAVEAELLAHVTAEDLALVAKLLERMHDSCVAALAAGGSNPADA